MATGPNYIDILASELDNIDSRLTTLNAELTLLQGETGADADVQSIIDTDIAVKQTRITNLTNRKTDIESRIAARDTADARTFTSPQQAVIDTIDSNMFGGHIENIRKLDDTTKTEFFTVYDKATTDFQRSCVIKKYGASN